MHWEFFPAGDHQQSRCVRDCAYAPVRAALSAHIARMLQLAGISAEVAAQQAQSLILDLETALATAKLTPVEAAQSRNNLQQNDRGRTSQALAPHFDLSRLLRATQLAAVPYVIVAEPRYMQALDALLVERPLEDFKIYLRWRVLNGVSQDLAPAIAEADPRLF